MTENYIDPNSGAAPQPGGYAGLEAAELGHALPVDAPETAEVEEVEESDLTDEEVVEEEEDAAGEDDEDSEEEVVEDGEDESDEETDGEAPVAYDPSQYGVADVLAHVEANPDQKDAVLAAEQAGKNRKGVVDGLSG